MNRTRRIAASVVLAATLIGGGATAASATSTPRPAPIAGHMAVHRDGVLVCIAALKWAHRKPSEDRADRAVIVCGKTVKTDRQAARLYTWANRKANQWALEYIG